MLISSATCLAVDAQLVFLSRGLWEGAGVVRLLLDYHGLREMPFLWTLGGLQSIKASAVMTIRCKLRAGLSFGPSEDKTVGSSVSAILQGHRPHTGLYSQGRGSTSAVQRLGANAPANRPIVGHQLCCVRKPESSIHGPAPSTEAANGIHPHPKPPNSQAYTHC